ncbi:hypothetical protein HPB48_019236 [Haemaphysalis longicornis]|uniref:Uncharacterized protein n=1 Tax=Haemaphysalis longicornis TaxID=44386 RepID=A0A9J6F935_HAELO|nr:hypothetical protein HPB48_019236 [Haemaphysalis longicornis]
MDRLKAANDSLRKRNIELEASVNNLPKGNRRDTQVTAYIETRRYEPHPCTVAIPDSVATNPTPGFTGVKPQIMPGRKCQRPNPTMKWRLSPKPRNARSSRGDPAKKRNSSKQRLGPKARSQV